MIPLLQRIRGAAFAPLLVSCAMLGVPSITHAQTVGQPLPAWSPGELDIHRISTGKGDAALHIFPDGTTLLVDPAAAPTQGPRHQIQRPDATRAPGEWIARYIAAVVPDVEQRGLDYALVTHFHGDHMGGSFPQTEVTPGGYRLSGITDVGHRLPIRTMIDRAWPDYNYDQWPEPPRTIMENYRNFLAWQAANRGMRVEKFQPGRIDQIVMKRSPAKYPGFEVRNIAASGIIWTGKGNATRPLFPSLDDIPPKDRFNLLENMSSIVFRLQYGKFTYYVGGDIPGVVAEGKPAWFDIETPVAAVTGPVDVAVLNHHGVRDTGNETFIRTLQPRVMLVAFWSMTHLDRKVLERLLSPAIYPGPRDIFSTNMIEAAVALNPELAKLKSMNGHVVVRVAPGGKEYKVIIVDDLTETFEVRAVHGPYLSQ
jgi:beta-lactamase superfamily II metal-dependent hydrolase